MYLKSIEIKGFKSFADKTELSFKGGITAVVGPNGSGKSNISDAVRWVLGEQSVKQLRGGKMEDVIFAGTQFRKPLGQAQVSLTLDNSCGTLSVPYNEVTVTRRLYRSGESEYLINNNNVRLKDINEIFMDTGIGREGYSMIGQGKIDAILSGKPEERRSLVEEAAGIIKFKTRKEEGERKLKNAQDNLNRVEDIISTYEERIGPLKKDKEKAQKFIIYDKELKELTVSYLLKDLEDLDNKNIEYIKSKESLTIVFNKISEDYSEANKKLEELDTNIEDFSNKKLRKKEEYYEIKGEIDNLEGQIRLEENEIKNTHDKIKTQEFYLNESIKEKQTIEVSLSTMEKDIKALETNFNLKSQEINELNKEFQKIDNEIKEIELKQDENKSSLNKIINEISTVETTLSKENGKLEFLKGKIENLSTVTENYNTSLKLNEEGLLKLNSEFIEISNALNEKTKLLDKKNKEFDGLKDKRDLLLKNIEDIRRRVRDNQNREGILKNLEESYEGYNRSVKDLLNYLKRSNNPNLISTNVLGEVIKTQEVYSQAIEASLGGYISNVITDTDKIASSLINILKKQNLGRCTFLPRNVIKANKISLPKVPNVDVIGLASDLVETSSENREIIDSILGRTAICENLDIAMAYARATNHRIKIVTLTGDIIAAGGAMTGGSQKGQKSGVISRKAEIDSLELKIKEDIEEGKKVSLEEKDIKFKIESQYNELISLREFINNKKIELERIKERKLGLAREIEKVNNLIKSEISSNTEVTASMNESIDIIKDLNVKITTLNENRDKLNLTINNLRTLKNEKYDLFDSVRDKLSKVKIEENEAKLILENKKNENLTSKDKVLNLQNKILELEETIKNLHIQLEDNNEKILKNNTIKESLNKSLEVVDKEIDDLDMEEVKLKSIQKEQQGKLNTLRDEYSKIEKELFKVNMALEKYESDKEEIVNKINEDLNLTIAEAKDLVVEIESKGKAKKRISELKGLITALGSVNLSAIEEYDKVSKHYEYLTTQKNDLLLAKDELLKLINDMTQKMRTLFKENFEILSKNFKETFKQLFNGGTAELILGPGDELTGNIEIQVQPPGKKLQNINLLSGGEKVLSAIALTFGILKMKPSPFCILDEIEAALDDANVYRYATFLKEFAVDTQFILITHRKGTMEAANVMYGVTMEEKGVSKIVSVDLGEEEEN